MDWSSLRKEVWKLMAPNGLTGSIVDLIKLALKFLLSYAILFLIILGFTFIPLSVGGLISGLIERFLGDSFITFILTIIFMVIGYIFMFAAIIIGMVGFANLFKNYVQTGNLNWKDILFFFKSDNKGLIMKVSFVWMIKVMLLSLLCVIPGVIYSWKTFCLPYILTENIDMNAKEVIALAKEMTKGELGNYFINCLICFLITLGCSCLSCCTLYMAPLLSLVFMQSVNAAYYVTRSAEFEESDDDYGSSDMESSEVY